VVANGVLRTTPESKVFEQRLLKLVAKASSDHQLLEPNDRVMVAVSGGKDSLVLLHLLREIQKKAPFTFSIVAVNVDQKQPGFPADVLPKYFTEAGYDYQIVDDDTYSIVKAKVPEGKTYCSLCSRLRRGILYTTAKRLGATKIALGHHRDDCIETLLLNAFFAGTLRGMPARLRAKDGQNVVIRPLIYCAESDIAAYAEQKAFPIIPCNLCGSQPNLQRRKIKELLTNLERDIPFLKNSLLSAVTNVRHTHLLDRQLTTLLGNPEAVEGDDSDRNSLVPIRVNPGS
jgi:tRNA 2-thiocytidine biosynthesis protein TtcA